MVYRDRTRDFVVCAEKISKTKIFPNNPTPRSHFYVSTKQLSKDITNTHEKLEKLSKCK